MSFKNNLISLLWALNFVHIVIGLINLFLAICQFTPSKLSNVFVDFRACNFIHVVTGCIGICVLRKNFGFIIPGSMYYLSMTLSLWCLAFYAFGIVEETRAYKSLQEITENSQEQLSNYGRSLGSQASKIVVCALLTGLGFLEFINNLSCLIILRKLCNFTHSEDASNCTNNGGVVVALVCSLNFVFCVIVIILGFLFEHLKSDDLHNIQIAWPEISGFFGLISSCLTLSSLFSNNSKLILRKMSFISSIFTATIALKSLDYSLVAHLPIDIRDYFDSVNRDSAQSNIGDQDSNFIGLKNEQQYQLRLIIHLTLITLLFFIFFHNVILTISSGAFIERQRSLSATTRTTKFDKSWKSNRRTLGFLQLFWGICIIALTCCSFLPWKFSKGYDSGSGIFWLGCLFFVSGTATSKMPRTMVFTVCTTSIICCILALESGIFSAHAVYQTVREYNNPIEYESKKGPVDGYYRGKIILYSIQCATFFLEFITAFCAIWRFGQMLNSLNLIGDKNQTFSSAFSTRIDKRTNFKRKTFAFLAAGHFAYGLTTLSISVASEVTTWRQSMPIQPLAFITNGSIVLTCGFIQLMAKGRISLLLISAILNIITGAISFFVMAPYSTQMYAQWAAFEALRGNGFASNSNMEQRESLFYWSVVLSFTVLFLSMLEFMVSITSAVVCFWNLHKVENSKIIDRQLATIQTQGPPLAFRTAGNLIYRGLHGFHLMNTMPLPHRYFETTSKSAANSWQPVIDSSYVPSNFAYSTDNDRSQFDPKVDFFNYFNKNRHKL